MLYYKFNKFNILNITLERFSSIKIKESIKYLFKIINFHFLNKKIKIFKIIHHNQLNSNNLLLFFCKLSLYF
jgi:hypothetical protein